MTTRRGTKNEIPYRMISNQNLKGALIARDGVLFPLGGKKRYNTLYKIVGKESFIEEGTVSKGYILLINEKGLVMDLITSTTCNFDDKIKRNRFGLEN